MSEFFQETIRFLATIMGILMSLAYYPQAYKIFKNKSAKDVSIVSFLILFMGTLTWLIYGFVFNDLQIVLGFFLGVLGSFLVLILTILYRKQS